MKLKRNIRAFSAAALLVSALALPATNTATAHGNQGCYDGSKVDGLISGDKSPVGWGSQNGAFATIDFHYDNCGDDDSAVAAWVGLAPDNTTGQIIQVGILQCRQGWTSRWATDPCYNYPDQLRYFYAFGGCNVLNGPYARDAGPATNGPHNYTVTRAIDGWYMYLPSGTWFVAANDSSVSCIGSSIQTSVQWGVEKWDRGDSSGGSTTKTTFTNMKHRTTGGSWELMNWGAIGLCQVTAPTAPHYSRCEDSGSSMWVWD